MTQSKQHRIRDLAAHCGGRFTGTPQEAECPVRAVATLTEATTDDVSWIQDEGHARSLSATRAAAVVGTAALVSSFPRAIVVEDAALAIAEILELFRTPLRAPAPGIHSTAVVHETAVLGKSVAVGAHVVIGPDTKIGDGVVIYPGVSIGASVEIGANCVLHDRCVIYDRCRLGNRVVLHAGVVIGADGFGYIFRDGRHRRIAHVGTVRIEDDVEIGANSCVDRAKVGATVVGRGTKIDNLVQVAHNVQVGPLCILAAQVGISGSTRLGTGVLAGGQVGIADGIEVGDGARLGAQSGVIADQPPGIAVFGTPAQKSSDFFRQEARVRKLPKLFDAVADLARRVANLEAAKNHPEDG